MTYTDSHAGSDAFSGETKSVGAGLYASAMFESGAYIDLIGKYVHHDNEYTATSPALVPETTAPTPGMPVRKSVTVTM